MANEITLAPRLRWLREALEPVLRKLEAALVEARPSASPTVSVRNVAEARRALEVTNARLQEAVKGLMNEVVEREEVSERDVYRVVWRFEVVLDVLMEYYRYFRVLRRRATGGDVCILLEGMFRHSLQEIRDWLQELVDTLINPEAALLRMGLPNTGEVKITLALALSTAPEAEQLQRWAAEGVKLPGRIRLPPARPEAPEPPEHPQIVCTLPAPKVTVIKQQVGFFDILLGSALGWGIGHALFGDD